VSERRGPESGGAKPVLTAHQQVRFEESVLPHLDAAYNLARHILRDGTEAEDAVQDGCLRALRHFDGFRGVDGRAWLLSIVRNTCLTYLGRRRAGGGTVAFDEELHSADSEVSGPEADLARAGAAEGVSEALSRLPVEFREALVLRELEGLSYKEIAQVTGAPIGTVMSRLARGRRQLARALGGGAKEGD